LELAYGGVLWFDRAGGRDGVFRDLVMARVIEAASKRDTPRVLLEVRVPSAPLHKIKRRLRGCRATVTRCCYRSDPHR
jgi:hypothetical protein